MSVPVLSSLFTYDDECQFWFPTSHSRCDQSSLVIVKTVGERNGHHWTNSLVMSLIRFPLCLWWMEVRFRKAILEEYDSHWHSPIYTCQTCWSFSCDHQKVKQRIMRSKRQSELTWTSEGTLYCAACQSQQINERGLQRDKHVNLLIVRLWWPESQTVRHA